MLVADTSAWLEYLTDGLLAERLSKMFPGQSQLIVPTLVQHELAKWLLRERGEDAADEMIAYTQECIVSPLNTQTAVYAAELCRKHRLTTADAIIYATAVRHNAELLTCDAHFQGLDGVIFVEKPKN
jgi:predicted nucleic acid-binding protein